MANYTGVRCPVCSKKFSSSDDIVVCPVCGAPHHRDCYAERGSCAFVEDHLSGKEWTPPAPEGAAETNGQTGGSDEADGAGGGKTCPSCGASNPEENVFCQSCGQRLFANEQRSGAGMGGAGYGFPGGGVRIDPISMAYGGLRPDEEVGGVPVRELAQYVGPNSAYYMPRFAAIAAARSAFLPNFAAFFAGFLYFFYRKMYAVGAFLLVVFLAGMVPIMLYTREMLPATLYEMGYAVDPTVNHQLANYYANWVYIANIVRLVVGVVAAMLANRMYYARVLRDVQYLREEASSPDALREQLVLRGGANRTLVIAVVAVLAVAFCILCSLLANTAIGT